jgi:hypothetical protein
LAAEPNLRFADAGAVLSAVEAGEAGKELPSPRSSNVTGDGIPSVSLAADADEALFRDVRRLLAARSFDAVVDLLDVHRPAEWKVVDLRGARTLRALGQAYLGRNDVRAACECLEQLRTAQRERPLLPKSDYLAALSDLCKCYRGIGLDDAARECQEEARRLP